MEPNEMPELIETVKRELAQRTPSLLIDGKLYHLGLTENVNGTLAFDQLALEAARAIRTERGRATQQLLEMRRTIQTTFPLPEITPAHVARGLVVYKRTTSLLTYSIPVQYAPKFIVYGGEKREIKPEYQAELKRDARFELSVSPSGTLYSINSTLANFAEWQHYHGGSESDCIGTLTIETPITPDYMVALAPRIEKMWQTINKDSPMHDHPDRFARDLNDLWATGIPAETWTTDPIRLGDYVKVIKVRDEFPPDLVGIIGKVISILERNSWGNLFLGVEFIVDIPQGHSADGNGAEDRCYYFASNELELMPPGTRRTRRPQPVEPANTEPTEQLTVSLDIPSSFPINFDTSALFYDPPSTDTGWRLR